MELLKKAYKCYSEDSGIYFSEIIYAETHGKAKAKYVKSAYDDITFINTKAVRDKMRDLYLFDGKEITLEDLNYKKNWLNWRNFNQNLVNNNTNAKVHIWSGQWNAYWCDNGSGYTTSENIGVYDIQDAWSRICSCGLEKQLSLQIIK